MPDERRLYTSNKLNTLIKGFQKIINYDQVIIDYFCQVYAYRFKD
jgi:hypothetical protein